ncbi:exosortase family protein XrtF [Psychroserpens algicola]|uniref:Exosortase family protein XrtF n=1 Tax=Psychroserpens algicola TaxID=1719034 RepID=A0ABT0HAU5_9FLAO|nr:exosortase family protein XrtF [Psychroserpens algicola]MCK8481302.1 exosortase family protein XrtF [Psychroserpens algicola]
MKALLIKYKSVVKFILTFLSVYFVLTLAYKYYLDLSDGSKYYPDYITHLVANQSELVLNAFGYDTVIVPHPDEPSMKLIVKNKFVARVVEGCNSISIIILFVSFIAAFSARFKSTFIYMLSGSVLIYSVNLLRIAILSIGLYNYPWRRDILHTVVFPMIIYGIVFLLWMFWVNRFSKQQKKHA